MPAKSVQERAKQAKKKGVAMTTKAGDTSPVRGRSRHAAKKSSAVTGERGFEDRSVSPAAEPGQGKRRRSAKLPLPDRSGSSSSRRRTLPVAAAARYRKSGRESQPTSTPER